MKAMARGALALGLMAGPLLAQEPWDPSFNLLAGQVSGLEDARIGQNKVLGLSMQGAYPLTLHGSVVLDFGYRYTPTQSLSFGSWMQENKNDAFFASAWYRHELFFDGFYLQGGLRSVQTRSMRREIIGSVGSEHYKAPAQKLFTPVLGLGYRFTDKISLDAHYSRAKFLSLDNASKTSGVIELALGIHLGK